MKDSIGGSFLTRSFSAEGEESLSLPVDQKGGAFYVYEEVAASQQMQVQFGGRVEQASFEPITARLDNATNACTTTISTTSRISPRKWAATSRSCPT